MTTEILPRLRGDGAGPLVYGHRGARGDMPENSMEGFRYLADLGINAVELDVQNTSDGIAVVWHDPWLQAEKVRDASGAWLPTDGPNIVDTSFADLRTFDIGALKMGTEVQERFPVQARLSGVGIPSLDEFCHWARALPDMVVNIEIKSFAGHPDLGDTPEKLAATVLQGIDRFGLADRTLISSFDWRVLTALRDQAPQIGRGYLSCVGHGERAHEANIVDGSDWLDGMHLGDYGNSLPRIVAANGGIVWAPHYEELTTDDLALARELGLIVNVWTVNEEADMRRLFDMGVDGLITDYPARAKALLENRQMEMH